MLVKSLNQKKRQIKLLRSAKPSMSLTLSGIFFTGCMFFFSSASAVEIPWVNREKLVISFTEAELNISQISGHQLVLDGADVEGQVSVIKKDGEIELRSKDQLLKSDFNKSLSAQNNRKLVLEVKVPSGLAPDIHVLDGSIRITGLSSGGFVQLQKGHLTLSNIGGQWRIATQKSDIASIGGSGQLKVDAYGGKVDLREFLGDVDLSHFSGDTTLEKLRGAVNVSQASGAIKITNSAGNLLYEIGKANLNVQQFLGRIEGQSGESQVSIQMSNEGDLRLRSTSGRVNIAVPHGKTTVGLNLQTQEGDLIIPAPMKVVKDGLIKSYRGKMPGDGDKKVSVFVRSQDGSIYVH